METVTVQEAQARLVELIHELVPGQEIIITENERPVAALIAAQERRPEPQPGRCKDMLNMLTMLTIVAEDNDHLDHFKDYVP